MFNLLNAVFLVLLGLTSNYLGEIFGCKTQQLLQNDYIKHICILAIIYFTVSFSDSENVNPITKFKDSVLIWAALIMTLKMSPDYNKVIFILLSIIYVLYDYIKYYKKNNIEHDRTKKLTVLINYLQIVVVCIILYGFRKYYNLQKLQHGTNFTNAEFFLRTNKHCV